MLRHGLGRARALAGGRRPSLSANAAALRRRPAAGLQLPPRPLAVRCLCSGPGGPGGGGSGDGGGDGAVPLGLPEPAATPAAGGGGSKQALGRVGGVKTPGAKISMTFTCDVCETRSTKIFHRHSYENGTVIVRCPGCDNLHLVADNLGWFLDGPEGYNIETILAAKGQSVRRAAGDEEDAAEFLPDGTYFADEKRWAAMPAPEASAANATAPAAPASPPPPQQQQQQQQQHGEASTDGASVGRVSLEELFAVVDGMGLADAQR
jgi:hypothetical protein